MGANRFIPPEFAFGSHLPVLIKALSITDGPVLEMGMGMSSSITMHWMCATSKRQLVSYENDPEFFKFAGKYNCDFHQVICLDDWSKADIDRPWDVALIDHSPAERRIVDIKRLANLAKYLVIHDVEGRRNRDYHYDKIWPLFKWKYTYDNYLPKTAVLSNLVDLTDFRVNFHE